MDSQDKLKENAILNKGTVRMAIRELFHGRSLGEKKLVQVFSLCNSNLI